MDGDNRQINIATELEDCTKLGQIVDIASGGSFCMILTSTDYYLLIINTFSYILNVEFICKQNFISFLQALAMYTFGVMVFWVLDLK